MYKMFQIGKEEYEKCEVEIRKDLKVESDVDKCLINVIQKKQKYRHELMPNTNFQQCRVFVRNDLVEKKIKSCRKSSKKFLEFTKS